MLIVKILINDKEIDEIYIHNTGVTDKVGRHIYNFYTRDEETKMLKGPHPRQFQHKRKRGWKPLVLQVLKYLVTTEEK